MTKTETVDAVSGEIAFAPSAAGTYYLATRTDATTDWCRYGILEVVSLVDLTYEQMKTELANVNSRIATAQGLADPVSGHGPVRDGRHPMTLPP